METMQDLSFDDLTAVTSYDAIWEARMAEIAHEAEMDRLAREIEE